MMTAANAIRINALNFIALMFSGVERALFTLDQKVCLNAVLFEAGFLLLCRQ